MGKQWTSFTKQWLALAITLIMRRAILQSYGHNHGISVVLGKQCPSSPLWFSSRSSWRSQRPSLSQGKMHSFVLTVCCLFVSELWWIWAIMTQLRSEVGRWWHFVYRVWGSATFHGCPDDSSERRGCRRTREGEGMWLFVCFGTSSLRMDTFHGLGLSC